nr:uncharacterized protein LOC113814829 [Penaeus vannamei]XP_027222694.1 uncharacterized protein LOC113814829 [Penaeus vannamei]
MKPWGRSEYWGLGAEYDPDWVLTEAQKQLRAELIELCRTKIRPRAPHFDRTYEYPRASMNDLAELRLLGLQVPEELGGRGENHVCVSMVAETIARYGCPSTAMVYCMHQAAVTTMLFRHHSNPRIRDLLSRLDKERLVGTVVFSDPATGTHFWYPLSSKVRQIDEDTVQMLKVASWATSAGLADWYSVQTVSPQPGHSTYSNLSIFLVFKDEVRASTDNWSAMGMHGNQSGPLVVEGKFPLDRMVGPAGDGGKSNDECGIVLLHQPCLSVERHRPRLPRRRQETRDPEGARRHGHARVRLPDCAGLFRRVHHQHQRIEGSVAPPVASGGCCNSEQQMGAAFGPLVLAEDKVSALALAS